MEGGERAVRAYESPTYNFAGILKVFVFCLSWSAVSSAKKEII